MGAMLAVTIRIEGSDAFFRKGLIFLCGEIREYLRDPGEISSTARKNLLPAILRIRSSAAPGA
jgi:hypothetical protein